MKLATLNKLPENSRDRIAYCWNSVYTTKDLDREKAFQFVAGITTGLHHAGTLSEVERKDLFAYYRKWFSL